MPMELYGFAIVPLIVGLVEVLKNKGLSSADAPIAAIILGLGAGFAVEQANPSHIWVRAIVYGVAYGLMASGIYSSVSAFTSKPDPTPTTK